jgi:hypothetical protein
MDWVIKSRDERTGRLGYQSYAEAEFINAAQELLGSAWKRLLLARRRMARSSMSKTSTRRFRPDADERREEKNLLETSA